MALLDSVDKIVTRYFSVVTAEEFEYKGKQYLPKAIKVSPLLFRDYTCPEFCGGCCPRFSLDYLPSDKQAYPLKEREIPFNGGWVTVLSDTQDDHSDYHCRNLNKQNGRCGIHGKQPFSCDFELIRMLTFSDNQPNVLTQKLFGRGWNMKRIDGERGALCTMTPITEKSINEVERKLTRLHEWCNHFGLKNKCPMILTWIDQVRPLVLHGNVTSALFTDNEKQTTLFL